MLSLVTRQLGVRPVVANPAASADCLFDIAGFDNMLDPVGITSPNAGEKICLQLEPNRKLVVFRLTDPASRRLNAIRNAEQILQVMSHFVRYDVGFCEIASCT